MKRRLRQGQDIYQPYVKGHCRGKYLVTEMRSNRLRVTARMTLDWIFGKT